MCVYFDDCGADLCVDFDDCGDKFEAMALDCCVQILMIVGTKYEAILCVDFDACGDKFEAMALNSVCRF